MAEISASTVMKLRKITGQGMMDCKKALEEAGGDMDAAVEILRKKGLATLAKRAGRETSEGTVVAWWSEDGKSAALATLCCETDFVAKSDDFKAAAEQFQKYIPACSSEEGADSILETAVDGKKYDDILTETVSKTGEKMQVGDYARFTLEGPGILGVYVHFNGKVATMVEITTSDDNVAASEIIKQAALDIAMHITATKPLALDKNGIDPDTVKQEKAIFADQVKDKPANIVEKIIEGKLKKFYAENCLLEQPFVKDDSKSVAAMLAEAAKEAGGKAEIKRYVRFELG